MESNYQEPNKVSTAMAFADYLNVVDKIVGAKITDEDIEGRLQELLRSAHGTRQSYQPATPELQDGSQVQPSDADSPQLWRRHRAARRVRRARTAEHLVTASARLLPGTKGLDWAEEFHAVLEELEETGAGRRTQLAFSLGFFTFALRMRLTFHASPSKRAAVERKVAEYRRAFQ